MACTGTYATAENFKTMFCADIDLTNPDEVQEINDLLALAAGDISAALAASDQCDCTAAAWSVAYLAKLNVIIAAVMLNCACGANLSDDRRATYQLWIDQQLELLRTGKLTICADDTGKEAPAFGVAEIANTDWSAAEIVMNRIKRTGA